MGDCDCDDDPGWIIERKTATGLPVRATDGIEKLSIARESSCCTVFANFKRLPGNLVTLPLVRLDLYASLRSMRRSVGTAFLTPGFNGQIISAAGIQSDTWVVRASATDPRLEVEIAMMVSRGCAEPSVFVPRSLQNPPNRAPPEFIAGSINPNGEDFGNWTLVTQDSGGIPGGVTLLPEDRIVSIYAATQPVLAGAIEITTRNGAQDDILVPADTTFRMNPRGNPVGPGSVMFSGGIISWAVEIVR